MSPNRFFWNRKTCEETSWGQKALKMMGRANLKRRPRVHCFRTFVSNSCSLSYSNGSIKSLRSSCRINSSIVSTRTAGRATSTNNGRATHHSRANTKRVSFRSRKTSRASSNTRTSRASSNSRSSNLGSSRSSRIGCRCSSRASSTRYNHYSCTNSKKTRNLNKKCARNNPMHPSAPTLSLRRLLPPYLPRCNL